MKKYSYAEDFNNVSGIARIGDADDVKISYSVLVGDPDSKGDKNFIGEEYFSADDFTTWNDAAKAKRLASLVLQQVDKNLEYGLKLSDVRDEVLDAIVDTKSNGVATKLEITRAVKRIFDYYISHGN